MLPHQELQRGAGVRAKSSVVGAGVGAAWGQHGGGVVDAWRQRVVSAALLLRRGGCPAAPEVLVERCTYGNGHLNSTNTHANALVVPRLGLFGLTRDQCYTCHTGGTYLQV